MIGRAFFCWIFRMGGNGFWGGKKLADFGSLTFSLVLIEGVRN